MAKLDESAREILVDGARGARVTYHPGYVQRDLANLLLARMMAAPWQREAPVIFGKAQEVRRRTCALGDYGLVYRYSGLDRVALPWLDELVPLLERLRVDFDRRLNFGLCNLYPNGDAAIGKHADAESDIVRDSPIVGLSLGAQRDFVLFESAGGRDQRAAELALGHGSVVVMWGSTQRFYKHAVPARRRCREARVNITFRCLIPTRVLRGRASASPMEAEFH